MLTPRSYVACSPRLSLTNRKGKTVFTRSSTTLTTGTIPAKSRNPTLSWRWQLEFWICGFSELCILEFSWKSKIPKLQDWFWHLRTISRISRFCRTSAVCGCACVLRACLQGDFCVVIMCSSFCSNDSVLQKVSFRDSKSGGH